MTNIDTETALIIGDDRKTTYDCKGKTDLYLPCTGTEFKDQAFKGARANGNTLKVTIYMNMYTDEQGNEHWGDVTLTFKNYNSIKNVYCLESNVNGNNAGSHDKDDYVTTTNWYQFVIEDLWTVKKDKYSVTGSNFSETINLSNSTDYAVGENNKGYTVKAGKGNDTITGTAGNDTITGGAGENKIYATGGDDVVNLTSGEKLVIKKNSKTVSGLALGENKNDLVVNFSSDNDSIILKNFVKKNLVGSKGSVYLDDIDLNNMSNDDSNLLRINNQTIKKGTATIAGTRLSDSISVTSPTADKYVIKAGEGNNNITLTGAAKSNTITSGSGDDYVKITNNSTENNALTTIKAGNGENHVDVLGSGNNSVTTGKGDDIISFAMSSETSTAATTVKAGGGNNYININNSQFGTVVLAEEKIKNTTNNIVINSTSAGWEDPSTNYTLIKSGNDLKVSHTNGSTLTLQSYFLEGTKYSNKKINDLTFDELMSNKFDSINVIGSGTLKGTKYADIIKTDDARENYSGKAKSDKIYAYSGNDTIDAGLGKNTIYITSGVDTILNSTLNAVKNAGQDTLVFAKGSKIRFSYTKDSETGKYDLKIYYDTEDENTGEYKNYVVLKNVGTKNTSTADDAREYLFDKNATSVTTIKIGSKSYKLETLLDRKTIKGVTGTIGNDDIWVNKTGSQTIFADAGSDIVYIGSSGSAGNDTQMIEDIPNIDPAKYETKKITPTVYTYTKDGVQDSSESTMDKVISYAKNGGTYYAQSAQNDIKVYGVNVTKSGDTTTIKGTDDAYYANVNQFTKIYDEGGEDKLYIKDAKSTDLTLLFDVKKDYAPISSDESYTADNISKSIQEIKILTKSQLNDFISTIGTESFDGNLPSVGIDIDYWGDKAARTSTDDLDILNQYKGYFGSGVEKIVANDDKAITSNDLAQLASTVAGWLGSYTEGTGDNAKSFDSVQDAFVNGNNTTRTTLLNVFSDNNPWNSIAAAE